jgi:hypothetical protein
MGLGLLVGAHLARRRRFQLHACCQSAVVVANLTIITVTMAPTLVGQIVPVLAVFRIILFRTMRRTLRRMST